MIGLLCGEREIGQGRAEEMAWAEESHGHLRHMPSIENVEHRGGREDEGDLYGR